MHVLQIPQVEYELFGRDFCIFFLFLMISPFRCWYMIHNTTNIRIGSITVIVDVIVFVVVAFEVMHS